jgi:hypothetical protein
MAAPYTLLIEKDGTNKFWHTHNGITAGRFAIEGDFTFTIDGNKCKVVEKDGASRFVYLAENISIKDNTDVGVLETGFSPVSLRNRLRELGYPKENSIEVLGLTTDELDAIHNAASPSASNPFATMEDVGSGGGGGSQNLQEVTDVGNSTTNPIIWTNGANKRIELGFFEGTQGLVFYDTDITTDPISFLLLNSDGSFSLSNSETDINQLGANFSSSNKQGAYYYNLMSLFDYASQTTATLKSNVLSFIKNDAAKQIDLIQDFTISGAGTAQIIVKYKGASTTETMAFLSDITATNADALKRDGSNANSNIDIGSNDFKANSIGAGVVQVLGGNDNLQLKNGSVATDEVGLYSGNADQKIATYINADSIYKYGNGKLVVDEANNTLKFNTNEVATQNYVDNKVAGLLDLRGNHNASGNTYPSSGGSGTAGAILKGDFWYISVAGTLGGVAVNVGDSIYALVDSPGTTSTNWAVLDANLSYVAEDSANKTNTVAGNEANTTKYLSVKGFYDYLIGMTWLTNSIFGTWMFGNTAKTTAVDADSLLISDSADSNKSKKLTLANLVTYLQNSFASKSMGAYKFRVNNTNATADATETNFKSIPKTTLSTTPTFTAGTAPGGTTDHSYSGQHIGSTFNGKVDLIYGTAGATVTQVVVPLPSDWPTPIKPNSLTAASERTGVGTGFSATNTTGTTQSQYACILRANAANNGFELVLSQASASSRYFHLNITYPTA